MHRLSSRLYPPCPHLTPFLDILLLLLALLFTTATLHFPTPRGEERYLYTTSAISFAMTDTTEFPAGPASLSSLQSAEAPSSFVGVGGGHEHRLSTGDSKIMNDVGDLEDAKDSVWYVSQHRLSAFCH